MTVEPLRLVTDESGDFDRLMHGDEVLVSTLCEDEVVDVEAELEAHGFRVTTRDVAEFVMPVGTSADWKHKATNNVDEWGLQDADTLLLAMQEELGELTQAYLEARAEDGDPDRIETELCDLGALCFQLAWSLDGRSEAPETRRDGGGDAGV